MPPSLASKPPRFKYVLFILCFYRSRSVEDARMNTREKRKNRVFAFCERYFRSFVDCAMMMRSLARSAFESHTNCDQNEHRRCLIIGIDAFTRTSSIAWCLTRRRRLSAFLHKNPDEFPQTDGRFFLDFVHLSRTKYSPHEKLSSFTTHNSPSPSPRLSRLTSTRNSVPTWAGANPRSSRLATRRITS